MKLSLELTAATSPKWSRAVMANFPAFLQDHADCERKASAMAMSFVAKYPDRLEIIPELIATGLEELEHFQAVYRHMEKRGIPLAKEIPEDPYIKSLLALCRTTPMDRFLDRLLLASIIECQGAERFRIVSQKSRGGPGAQTILSSTLGVRSEAWEHFRGDGVALFST